MVPRRPIAATILCAVTLLVGSGCGSSSVSSVTSPSAAQRCQIDPVRAHGGLRSRPAAPAPRQSAHRASVRGPPPRRRARSAINPAGVRPRRRQPLVSGGREPLTRSLRQTGPSPSATGPSNLSQDAAPCAVRGLPEYRTSWARKAARSPSTCGRMRPVPGRRAPMPRGRRRALKTARAR